MTHETPINVSYENDSIRTVNLPKWPALIVVGKKVTTEQAAEILIRTDAHLPNFKYASNDPRHEENLNALFGIREEADLTTEYLRERWSRIENLRERLGILELGYLTNNQIISAYIGGPHGWCNWNGDIFTNSYNIGKWPSIKEVVTDWSIIASAFPFLDLKSQLFSGETCEPGDPVVEFSIHAGNVDVMVPSSTLAPPVFDVERDLSTLFMGNTRERGITVNGLRQKLESVYGEIPQL